MGAIEPMLLMPVHTPMHAAMVSVSGRENSRKNH